MILLKSVRMTWSFVPTNTFCSFVFNFLVGLSHRRRWTDQWNRKMEVGVILRRQVRYLSAGRMFSIRSWKLITRYNVPTWNLCNINLAKNKIHFRHLRVTAKFILSHIKLYYQSPFRLHITVFTAATSTLVKTFMKSILILGNVLKKLLTNILTKNLWTSKKSKGMQKHRKVALLYLL